MDTKVLHERDGYELITRDGMGLAIRDGDKEYPFTVKGSSYDVVSFEVKADGINLKDRTPANLFTLFVNEARRLKDEALREEALKNFRTHHPYWVNNDDRQSMYIRGYIDAKKGA